jgi:hypothetical protein
MPTHAFFIALAALALAFATARAADDDDQPQSAPPAAAQPELTRLQQQAVGITLVHPRKATAAAHLDAYGEVLDVSSLISDAGHVASARAAQRAADMEAQRLEQLYRNGADASLRALESAQAAAVEARTQAQSAQAVFVLQWGPLARQPEAARSALIQALIAGHTALVRADLPGRVHLEELPHSATLSLDGAPTVARVLGPLPRSAAGSQSVGLLLELDHPPVGLGAGARIPVALLGAASNGVIVPDAALLYGEQGVYVYRQLAQPGAGGKLQFAPVAVRLLQSAGDAWLVAGLDDDDLIVANGAGVLWSLQGLGTFSAEEEDHD